MDTLTHTLVGLALGRAGLSRMCERSPWVLVLAANAPDIDVLSLAGGPLKFLEWHRQATHSFLAIPLLALAVATVASAGGSGHARRGGFWRMAVVAFVGIATHIALDWLNEWGVMLLWPFSREWFAAGAVHLVDVWVWLILAAAFVPTFLARLVSSEIGAQPPRGGTAAIFALLLLMIYCTVRGQLHRRALATLDARLYGSGVAPVRVLAVPDAMNPFRWESLVETARFWWYGSVNLREEFDPLAGRITYKPSAGTWMRWATKSTTISQFQSLAQIPYWNTGPWDVPEGSSRVELGDLRFGGPLPGRVSVWVILDPAGAPVSEGIRKGFWPGL